MRKLVIQTLCCLSIFAFFSINATAQTAGEGYGFKVEKACDATAVKNQQNTGTCWSFSTTSFVESELLRMDKGNYDLSEMYIVRQIYMEKAITYMRRQGKAQFSQGSLSHDVMTAIKKYGVVPEAAFNGLNNGDTYYNHSELVAVLKSMLDAMRKSSKGKLSNHWKPAIEAVLDVYLGEVPETFEYEGKTYDAKSFAKKAVGINPSDYIEISSYSHHDFYAPFVLEVPDNFSNGLYYNVPFADMERITDNAVNLGYTVAWDCDVSEKGFSSKNGVAVLPAKSWKDMTKEEAANVFKAPVKEQVVTQEMRQTTFDDQSTTDDHLMHITGIAKDKKGNKYYQVKNSWGEVSEFKGYLYASKAYFQLKTVAVMVHKDAIPSDIQKKLGI
ncbi:MAG: aminopeptidase C [Saprospiraceae bacterium]